MISDEDDEYEVWHGSTDQFEDEIAAFKTIVSQFNESLIKFQDSIVIFYNSYIEALKAIKEFNDIQNNQDTKE